MDDEEHRFESVLLAGATPHGAQVDIDPDTIHEAVNATHSS